MANLEKAITEKLSVLSKKEFEISTAVQIAVWQAKIFDQEKVKHKKLQATVDLIEQELTDRSIAARWTLHCTNNLLVLGEQTVDTLQAVLDHDVDRAIKHL